MYEVCKEVVVASLFLSLKDPGYDPGAGGFLLRLGAG